MSIIKEEVAVLKATQEQLSKRGGYSPEGYFYSKGRNKHSLSCPGPDVGATCALGGIEQAIYLLTGEVVGHRARADIAQEGGGPGKGAPRHLALYARVVKRLNRLTRKLYPLDMEDNTRVRTIEELTFVGSTQTSRKKVLDVIKAAIAEAETARKKAA